MATMRDIAKKAGVGVGTVSRALSDTGYTAKATREKILATADEMGYDYESSARIPVKTVTVAVTVPLLQHPFFAKMADMLEAELHQRGCRCLFYNSSQTGCCQPEVLELLEEGSLNGLIALNDPPPGFTGRGSKAVVAMDRDWGEDVPLVRSDHDQGGRLAAEAFLESGCRKVIQFMGGNLTPIFNPRHFVLEQILRNNGCQVTSVHTPWNSMGYSYDKSLIHDYWNVIREMDGCMANDIAALSCLSTALDLGIQVPEQLRIIAYDGTDFTALCRPALSAVEQDCAALAAACVDRIMELIDGTNHIEMKTSIPVIWKSRGTT